MKSIGIYFTFNGNCEEAMNFYKTCFNAEKLEMQTFGESPVDCPDEYKNKIMHAEFKAEGVEFMASDIMPGQPYNIGDNISLNINVADAVEQKEIFERLSDGGIIIMPLQDTFWNAHFGMVKDKFGITWMLNRSLQQ